MIERPPTFTLHTRDDLSEYVTVDYWPDRVLISEDIIRTAKPGIFERAHNPETDADEITITVANGQATYRVEGRDDGMPDVLRTKAVRRQWVGEQGVGDSGGRTG